MKEHLIDLNDEISDTAERIAEKMLLDEGK